ncbi:MAG TPA: hypothetical protein VNE62_06685 [Actinomycetota bacterium]|nr:hypothetical protein [Actinomycetota bacterium]
MAGKLPDALVTSPPTLAYLTSAMEDPDSHRALRDARIARFRRDYGRGQEISEEEYLAIVRINLDSVIAEAAKLVTGSQATSAFGHGLWRTLGANVESGPARTYLASRPHAGVNYLLSVMGDPPQTRVLEAIQVPVQWPQAVVLGVSYASTGFECAAVSLAREPFDEHEVLVALSGRGATDQHTQVSPLVHGGSLVVERLTVPELSLPVWPGHREPVAGRRMLKDLCFRNPTPREALTHIESMLEIAMGDNGGEPVS